MWKFLIETFKLFKQNPLLVYAFVIMVLVFVCLVAAIIATI